MADSNPSCDGMERNGDARLRTTVREASQEVQRKDATRDVPEDREEMML